MKYLNAFTTLLFCMITLIPLTALGGRAGDDAAPQESQESQQMQSAFIPIPQETKPDPKASLSGMITDEDGNPLGGVEVQCVDQDGKTVAEGVTDERGIYLFEDLPQGDYTIRVSYSGYEWKKIEFKGGNLPPPAPTSVVIYEIDSDVSGKSMLRVQWDHVRGATHYRCELIREDDGVPLREYPDMLQNFCEFGGLDPDTEYEVHVYARNDAGYSSDPARARSRTKGQRPKPPFGVGVTYARNNVVELVWNHAQTGNLEGFLIQVRKEGGKYLYYSKDGFTLNRTEAYVVRTISNDYIQYRIDDRLDSGVPFIENTVPYSFRIMAKDERGNLSKASHAVTGILLEDTIPPKSPTNLQYEFVGDDLLRLTWETEDLDVSRYRISYGAHEDRWDGVSYTSRRHYDIRIDRESFPDGQIYVRVVAIDRAGNESGYQPLKRGTTLEAGDDKTENIILSSELGYKDRSIAIREVARKTRVKKSAKKKTVKPKRYGFEMLKKNGFIIQNGETATLGGEIVMPPSAVIVVKSGGRLLLKDVVIGPANNAWGGIRFRRGAGGSIENATIKSADVGIAIDGIKDALAIDRVTLLDCNEYGMHIEDSVIGLDNVVADRNGIGLIIEDSSVSVRNSVFRNNERAILADNHDLTVEDSVFSNNRVYGIRLYGGGTVQRNKFRGNYVAMVFERGAGTATVLDNLVEYSSIDGVVVSSSEVIMKRNIIARNENHGIYIKNNANPTISESDIVDNGRFAVVGGGRIAHCHIARNNGSIYIDDTEQRGIPDNVFNASSAGVIKQIYRVDFIDALSYTSVVQRDS